MTRAGPDLLSLPGLGRFLRWKHARSTLQAILLGAAAAIVIDGLFGPPVAPTNLAGTLPWIHWRGLVVIALLVAGNLFCAACPFMLPRKLAKRLFPAGRHWPAALRSKWLAVGLLALFLWAYEAYDLWASPWLTAWLVVGYFVAAFAVDAVFRGAAFCKYLCPIGQFNFMGSLISPLEVSVRDPGVCASCATKDCIRGRWEPAAPLPPGAALERVDAEPTDPFLSAAEPQPLRLVQTGCELWLFQPRKVGNMDCTFCLDCIQACPHDNVGILTRLPGVELTEDPLRSGIGRFSQRPDLAALVLLLTFGAFVNAFGMVAPAGAVRSSIGTLLGGIGSAVPDLLIVIGGTLVVPGLLVAGAAAATQAAGGRERDLVSTATRYAYSLVPVGVAMWAAHHLHHFLVGGFALVPLAQSWLVRAGLPLLGEPLWELAAVVPEQWIFPLQLLLLEGGALLGAGVAIRLARHDHPALGGVLRAAAPWALLSLGLAALGLWILTRPMEMRGMMMG